MEENKNKKKIIIGIVSIVIIVIIAITAIIIYNNNNNNDDNNADVNKNEDQIIVQEKDVPEHLLEEKKFEKIKLKDIYMHAVEGSTIFRAKAENISDELMKDKTLTIIFIDNNGEECDRVVYPLESVRTGEFIEIDYLTTNDVTNIKDISVEIGEKEVTE